MEWLLLVILSLLGLAVALLTLPRLAVTPRGVWVPKIARLRAAPVLCRLCGQEITHGGLAVWLQRNDDRTDLAHAGCAVLIRGDHCVYRLDGTMPPGDWQITEGYVLLTQEEWEAWEKSDEVSVPRGVC